YSNYLYGALFFVLLSGSSNAQDVTFSLSLGDNPRIEVAGYTCDDGVDRIVKYISAGSNVFALLSGDGETLVFANVISGSGSRYVGGPYEWWIKGGEGTLTNAMNEQGKVQCA